MQHVGLYSKAKTMIMLVIIEIEPLFFLKTLSIYSQHVGKFFIVIITGWYVSQRGSNDYVVHDPLLEKGKEKFNQMRQAKETRTGMGWQTPCLDSSMKYASLLFSQA